MVGALAIRSAAVAAGGPALRQMLLHEELFEATAMSAVNKNLVDMKVTELKEELAARDEDITGNKAYLRRRLHAAIMRAHLDAEDTDGL